MASVTLFCIIIIVVEGFTTEEHADETLSEALAVSIIKRLFLPLVLVVRLSRPLASSDRVLFFRTCFGVDANTSTWSEALFRTCFGVDANTSTWSEALAVSEEFFSNNFKTLNSAQRRDGPSYSLRSMALAIMPSPDLKNGSRPNHCNHARAVSITPSAVNNTPIIRSFV